MHPKFCDRKNFPYLKPCYEGRPILKDGDFVIFQNPLVEECILSIRAFSMINNPNTY